MKQIVKRLAAFLRFNDLHRSELSSQAQSPIITAWLASFISLVLIYWIASPAVALLGAWWIKWLAYSLIPMSVSFIILYRSRWHPEIVGVARTCSLILFSSVLFCTVLLTMGAILLIGCIFTLGFKSDMSPQ